MEFRALIDNWESSNTGEIKVPRNEDPAGGPGKKSCHFGGLMVYIHISSDEETGPSVPGEL
jgi:hypothetical protein